MTFAAALQDLERRGIMPLRVPSLEPTRLALSKLSLRYPSDLRQVVLVAGTNGKGSTSKTLEALLLHAGRRVGLYTSPHLVNYRERISLNGQPISEELFVHAWKAVTAAIGDTMLSHFEMLTVMAAWVFFSGEAYEPVETAIFEVGLGGTWDATNAIPHGTAVIARLGFDHQDYLGNTMGEIARNKFGIVSGPIQVLHLPLPPEAVSLKNEVEAATGSHWTEVRVPQFSVDTSRALPLFYLDSRWGRTEISLPGARGAENMNLALEVFASLGGDPAVHLQALADVKWPARMQKLEIVSSPCPVFLSGDHNPQGIESLLELLNYYRRDRLLLVIGIGAKKELDPMMLALTSLSKTEYWLTRAEFQGRTRLQYGQWLESSGGFFEQPLDALAAALRGASKDDLCVITGSLYLAGDVLYKLTEKGTAWNVFGDPNN